MHAAKEEKRRVAAHARISGSQWLGRVARQSLQLVLIVELDVAEVDVLLLGRLGVLAVPGLGLVDLGQLGALEGRGAAPAVAQVAQELVDAVLGEAAFEQRVLHLLDVDGGEGRVAEATDLQGLLDVGLGAGLRPDPSADSGKHFSQGFLSYILYTRLWVQ